MTEILIYGLEKGETRDYMETLLACFKRDANAAANVQKVQTVAAAQGWHSFRIANYDGSAPNFAKALNI